jgi:hypothetical protein
MRASDNLWLVGNRGSFIVHVPECEFADKIHPDNFEEFESLENAFSYGYRECIYCMGGGREKEIQWILKKQLSDSLKSSQNDAGCCICGYKKAVQKAHLHPRSKGGIAIIPLCPNCHWNYEHNLLSNKQKTRLIDYLRGQK